MDAPYQPPPWLDASEYPFRHHFLDLPSGRMHYVDEGAGEPIVVVHGIPTWSFMYRGVIGELGGRFRCLAPDNLGFGLSDKPTEPARGGPRVQPGALRGGVGAAGHDAGGA